MELTVLLVGSVLAEVMGDGAGEAAAAEQS